MRQLGVIGPLSRDEIGGGEPRIGGGPWHAARALRALRQEALIVASCGEAERQPFQRRIAALGLPASLTTSGETTAFSFTYDADGRREMRVGAIGRPWTVDALPDRILRRVEWLHVAPLLRDDFPPETLERLARGRRILLDGHGLVRRRELGPLALDGDFDRSLLRHVSILKLADEEARSIVGEDFEALRGLGIPEILLTFGAEGSLVLWRGGSERIHAQAVDGDPTGAGDAFAVAYLGARAAGHSPVSAARRATGLVSALLTRRSS